MIDITILREDPEALGASLASRGVAVDIDALTDLDNDRRAARFAAEELRARQKESGKAISKLHGDDKAAAIAEAGELSESYKETLAKADLLDEEFNAIWITLPNMTDPTAAHGLEEEDAVQISTFGVPPVFDFEAKDHVDLGTSLGILDVERAAKVSGSRFGYILGKLAIVEFSLVRYAMDNLMKHGFVPVVPPVLVREHALYGTGFFPGTAEQVYEIPEDDLFLVGTSEVPIAAFHADEIFDADQLPIRYAGYSTCFRREAGTYGKDTRGIFRVHQFDKVEMFSFVEPENAKDEHDFLLAREEDLIQGLELPYQVVNVAAGDLGESAAKKYDIEAWFPAQDRYREITSTSNTTDYQSRRLKIRYRSEAGNRLVHTLNGTAIAVGRILIALMENHQQPDGTIRIPEKLAAYTGFDVIDGQ
ncbi:MAG: serine--tRNA ligase [Acidimicrobiia bacterium]